MYIHIWAVASDKEIHIWTIVTRIRIHIWAFASYKNGITWNVLLRSGLVCFEILWLHQRLQQGLLNLRRYITACDLKTAQPVSQVWANRYRRAKETLTILDVCQQDGLPWRSLGILKHRCWECFDFVLYDINL